MKRLTITYNDTTLFDGTVDEFAWQDSAQQVSVVGKFKRQPAQSAGGGLLEMLTSARKDKTAAIVQERKAELDLEAQE